MISKGTKELFYKKLLLTDKKTFYMRSFLPAVLLIGFVFGIFSTVDGIFSFLKETFVDGYTDYSVYLCVYATSRAIWSYYIYKERFELFKLSERGFVLTVFHPIVWTALAVIPLCFYGEISKLEIISHLIVGVLYFVTNGIYFLKRRFLFEKGKFNTFLENIKNPHSNFNNTDNATYKANKLIFGSVANMRNKIIPTLYIVVLLIQILFFVPYGKYTMFTSSQNVPHTELVSTKYDSIFEDYYNEYGLTKDKELSNNKNTVFYFYKLNIPQFAVQIIITTLIFGSLYLITYKNKEE